MSVRCVHAETLRQRGRQHAVASQALWAPWPDWIVSFERKREWLQTQREGPRLLYAKLAPPGACQRRGIVIARAAQRKVKIAVNTRWVSVPWVFALECRTCL